MRPDTFLFLLLIVVFSVYLVVLIENSTQKGISYLHWMLMYDAQGPGRGDRPGQAAGEQQLPHNWGKHPPQTGAPRISKKRHHLHPRHRPGSLRSGVSGAKQNHLPRAVSSKLHKFIASL